MKMTNQQKQKLITYAKNKILAKTASDKCKSLEPEIYSLMVDFGEQKNDTAKSTFKVDIDNSYTISATDNRPTDTVNYKALAMALLHMTDKEVEQYAKKNGYTSSRKGSTTYKVNIIAED